MVGFKGRDMELFKIKMKHHSPKDSEMGIVGCVITDSEKAVYEHVDSVYSTNGWAEAEEEGETFKIYDDSFNQIGTETFLDRRMRLRGDIDDDCNNYADAYYGLTFYGWESMGEISEADADTLARLGIAERI